MAVSTQVADVKKKAKVRMPNCEASAGVQTSESHEIQIRNLQTSSARHVAELAGTDADLPYLWGEGAEKLR